MYDRDSDASPQNNSYLCDCAASQWKKGKKLRSNCLGNRQNQKDCSADYDYAHRFLQIYAPLEIAQGS